MTRRTTLVRFLALLWAALQVASPGLSAIADGNLARGSASGPSTHVESQTTANCPVVHQPDCGLCRYLNGAASTTTPAQLGFFYAPDVSVPTTESCAARRNGVVLPQGRAPPAI